MVDGVSLWGLQGSSMMNQGNISSYLPLKAEMGGFLIPADNSSGDSVHGLDLLHDSYKDPHRVVADQGGGVFGFIILGMDNVQFKLIGILLELLSSGNVGGGKLVHGFLLNIGVSKCLLKVFLKGGEGPEGLVGKSLLTADFSPCGG